MNAFEFLKQAKKRRLDVVMLGDSNQSFGGFGFDEYFNEVLGRKYGLYATPQYKTDAVLTNSDVQGPRGASAQTGFGDVVDLNDPNYIIQGEVTGTKTVSAGMIVQPGKVPFNTESDLRGWFAFRGETAGAGQFIPRSRLEAPPYSTLAGGSTPITTNVGNTDLQYGYLDLPAGQRPSQFSIGWSSSGGQVTAPLKYYFSRMEDLRAETGVSVHSLFSVGGASARDALAQLQTYSDTQLAGFLRECRRLQIAKGYEPRILIYINFGLNDRNEFSPSVGTYKEPLGDSAAAYRDNVAGLKAKIDSAYVNSGWPLEELHYLFIGSHVVEEPLNSELEAYRAELDILAERSDRVTVFHVSDYVDANEIDTRGWYDVNGPAHLTREGYEAITNIIVDR